ncbi:tail fiber protein [Cytobacillus gottheilii]|uniref:Tail fiber protein n=1 Tax=Cytobacillus gottheilii TaxID=859144 RepID=A0ABX8FG74_9BACI|nr:phage tail protein [Cytobacillus gottheilii]QVY62998.1 tail fiber protein [Cytobacillus gottheilii]
MPELTPRVGIKKPLGNENVTRQSFNENWDIIDAKVATLGPNGKVPANQLDVDTSEIENELTAHKEEKASITAAGHVQLSNSVISTSEILAATPRAVKTAMDRANQAFQSASEGKAAIASAITAMEVSASPSDTFATLASKIGQIETGKKWAVGSLSSQGTFELTVAGLDFTPSVVIAYTSVNNMFFDYYIAFNPTTAPYPYRYNNNGVISVLSLLKVNDGSNSPTVAVSNGATFSGNGFRFNVEYANSAYDWIAYE